MQEPATVMPQGHFAALGSFLFHYREALFPFACLTVWLPGPPIFPHPLTAVAVGLVIALIGQLIRIATIGLEYIIRGGKNRRVYAEDLVTSGVYAHCRNPMYVGNMLILAGVAVGSNSWMCVIVVVPLFTVAYMAIVAAEEQFLRSKFGPAFDEYCHHVPRWIPYGIGMAEMLRRAEFKWRRVLVKEYGTPFGWIIGFSVLTLWHLYRRGEIAEQDELVQLVTAIIVVTIIVRLRVRHLKKTGRLIAD
jgi:protein-S-isoprenylcysteine O-methyltransferase Ste14